MTMYTLGTIYATGIEGVVEKDLDEARLYCESAAARFHAAALYQRMYANGRGVERAVQYYELAAWQGHTAAQYNLGVAFMHGAGALRNYFASAGVGEDAGKAFELFEAAAKQELPRAMVALGECCEIGYGVERSAQKAFEWYSRAAEKGDLDAAAHVARCLIFGIGVEKEPDRGVALLQAMISANEHSMALMLLATLHHTGLGVQRRGCRVCSQSRSSMQQTSRATTGGMEHISVRLLLSPAQE